MNLLLLKCIKSIFLITSLVYYMYQEFIHPSFFHLSLLELNMPNGSQCQFWCLNRRFLKSATEVTSCRPDVSGDLAPPWWRQTRKNSHLHLSVLSKHICFLLLEMVTMLNVLWKQKCTLKTVVGSIKTKTEPKWRKNIVKCGCCHCLCLV